MKRNLESLSNKEFDLVIVGAGMFGVCSAWEAAHRGLSVAIVERGDFCQATSANHFKMVHGGIRYLQHADIPRIRESSSIRKDLETDHGLFGEALNTDVASHRNTTSELGP